MDKKEERVLRGQRDFLVSFARKLAHLFCTFRILKILKYSKVKSKYLSLKIQMAKIILITG